MEAVEFPIVLTVFSEEIVKGEFVKVAVVRHRDVEAATRDKDSLVAGGFAVESNVTLPLATP